MYIHHINLDLVALPSFHAQTVKKQNRQNTIIVPFNQSRPVINRKINRNAVMTQNTDLFTATHTVEVINLF